MSVRLAYVAMHSPTICGECKYCRVAGDFFARYRNYVINLRNGEPETERGAALWLTKAYPPCPPKEHAR